MLCEKCEQKPIAKGIKMTICPTCGRQYLTNLLYNNTCGECCKKANICVWCNEEK